MEDIKVQLGARIRELRRLRGITQEELSYVAPINAKYLGEIERGEANFSIELIERLAQALNVPVYTMFLFPDLRDADETLSVIERITAKLSSQSPQDLTKIEKVIDVLLNS